MSHSSHRIGLIYNPFAGGLKGGGRARLDKAVLILREAGAKVELLPTSGPNTAGDLAREAAEGGCRWILAAGGDGTINEAVNGIVGTDVVFGVLPAGTANVLAKEIGLATRPDHAASQLATCVPARIALGRLERSDHSSRYFILMAGVGLDARIVYELDLNLKNRLGKLAYWHGGFRQIGRPVPRFHISVNGSHYCASFALVTRVQNYGGDFRIARRVRLTDEDFEIVIFRDREWRDYVRFFGAIVSNRLVKTPGVTILRATRAEVSTPEDSRIYIQADGEAVGVLPAGLGIAPSALTILLPESYLKSARAAAN